MKAAIDRTAAARAIAWVNFLAVVFFVSRQQPKGESGQDLTH
jgi:hypothetical protein